MESKKIGLNYGIILGGISIIYSLCLYLFGAKAFVSPAAYIAILFPIVLAVLGGRQQKKLQGGYLEFSEALKTTFTILVLGALMSTAFMVILLNYIDHSFGEALNQETAMKTEEFMRKFGAPEADIEKASEKIMNENNYSLAKQSVSFAFGCIFWFLLALIISAIIKKKKPEFELSIKSEE